MNHMALHPTTHPRPWFHVYVCARMQVVKRMRQVVGSGSKNTASDYKAALNCVRLVTRLLPFITEDQSDDFLEAVFWRSELPVTAAAAPAENNPSADAAAEVPAESAAVAQPQSGDHQPTTDVITAVEPAATGQSPTYEPAAGVLADALLFKGEDPTDPLAIRLLNAIVNLLFYPNFTVSPLNQAPAESAETFPLEHVWEPGVGVQDVREPDLLSSCTPCVSVVWCVRVCQVCRVFTGACGCR